MPDSSPKPSVADVRSVSLPHSSDGSGILTVVETGEVLPFEVRRIFVVTEQDGAIRGQHAHRTLNQLLWCPAGQCDVLVEDGQARDAVRLDRPNLALLIPAGIWAEQRYLASPTVLVVACDAPYDEADYIRDYEAFMRYRRS